MQTLAFESEVIQILMQHFIHLKSNLIDFTETLKGKSAEEGLLRDAFKSQALKSVSNTWPLTKSMHFVPLCPEDGALLIYLHIKVFSILFSDTGQSSLTLKEVYIKSVNTLTYGVRNSTCASIICSNI